MHPSTHPDYSPDLALDDSHQFTILSWFKSKEKPLSVTFKDSLRLVISMLFVLFYYGPLLKL